MTNMEIIGVLISLRNVLHKSPGILKKFPIIIINVVIVFYSVILQANTWQPSPGHKQIPIWPEGKMPDAISDTKEESVTTYDNLVAGKLVTLVGGFH